MKIPGLTGFILSSLPPQSNRSQTLAINHVEVKIEWLFPEELEAIRYSDPGDGDWAEGTRLLKMKANSISANVGGGTERGDVAMSLVPPGLINRWRIWKILELIAEE